MKPASHPAFQPPTDFWQDVVSFLKVWPNWLRDMVQNPVGTINKMPLQGRWQQPVTYLCTSAILTAILQLLWLKDAPQGLGLRLFMQIIGSVAVGYAFFAVLIHVGLTAIKERPGLYRTAFFVGVISMVAPAGALLGWFHGLLSAVVNIWALYATYLFAQVAGKLEKREALFFVIGLVVVGALLSWFLSFSIIV